MNRAITAAVLSGIGTVCVPIFCAAAERSDSPAFGSVTAVFPSGPSIPQRLLRISIVFAAAQDDTMAQAVRLKQGGRFLVHPFADPPLWSPDRTMLTLLLDPSRQKRGLANNRERGFILNADEPAELRIESRVVKTWNVTPGSCPPLDPARWSISPVHAGSLDPLTVSFGSPIDALSQDYVAIASRNGTRAVGGGRLADAEQAWSFLGVHRWTPGDRLAIHPRLEDPCGNEVDEPFEHPAGQGLGSDRETTFVPIPFAPGVSR